MNLQPPKLLWWFFRFKKMKKGELRMKNKLLPTTILATVLSLLSSNTTLAAVKCVQLNTNSQCQAAALGKAGWSGDCGTRDRLPVEGVAICASSSGTTASSLSVSPDPTKNGFCWCRLISPAVSQWVYSGLAAYHEDCLGDCAEECAASLASDSTFRTRIFSNLSD